MISRIFGIHSNLNLTIGVEVMYTGQTMGEPLQACHLEQFCDSQNDEDTQH